MFGSVVGQITLTAVLNECFCVPWAKRGISEAAVGLPVHTT